MPLELKDVVTAGIAFTALIVTLRERHNSLRVALFNRQADAYHAISEKIVELERAINDLIEDLQSGMVIGIDEAGERIHNPHKALLDVGATNEHLQTKFTVTQLGIVSIRYSVFETCVLHWAQYPYDIQLFQAVVESRTNFKQALRDYSNMVRRYLAVDRIGKSFKALNKQMFLDWGTHRQLNRQVPSIAAIDTDIPHEDSRKRYEELTENMNALFKQVEAKIMPVHPEALARYQVVKAIRDETIRRREQKATERKNTKT